MTQPTEPVTPPAAPPVPAPPAAVQPPAAPVAPPVTPPAVDDNPWADPAKAEAEIKRLRQENAASRTNAKQQAADEARQSLAQQIGKALGLVPDGEPADPAKLTEQLTATQAQAKQAALELAVFRAAGDTGANANALLDSRSFLAAVESLEATDAAGITAAIAAAVQKEPRLRATQAAAVGGAQIVGSGSAPARTYTRDQLRDPAFFAANKADILAAHGEGRIRE